MADICPLLYAQAWAIEARRFERVDITSQQQEFADEIGPEVFRSAQLAGRPQPEQYAIGVIQSRVVAQSFDPRWERWGGMNNPDLLAECACVGQVCEWWGTCASSGAKLAGGSDERLIDPDGIDD